MMRAYVDTNILVDLVLARQEFLPNAQRVFALGYAGEVQLVVSALSFVNTIYLGRKYKYPMNEVCEKLRLIADFVEVADLKGQNVVDMLSSDWKDYEDATQYRSVLQSNRQVLKALFID
jgi:predicted nucleic acid-binding protein